MSVSVSEMLKLPCLRHATVIGGKGGLAAPVNSITVLEGMKPNSLVEDLFNSDSYDGGELVITGFIHAHEDVQLQKDLITRLAEMGEVGLIVFYVGVFVPKIDQRLIDLANELDFVLIQMPPGRHDLRYSDVIAGVMERILKDRRNEDNIVIEMLEAITRLPQHQQTVTRLLRLLSLRISASLVLQDRNNQLINCIPWPRNLDSYLTSDFLRDFKSPKKDEPPTACPFLPNATMYSVPIQTTNGQLTLTVIKEGELLREETCNQVQEIVRLGLNMWGEYDEHVAVKELISSIINDEPMKMRRLADIFNIDVASINEMWILHGTNELGREILSTEVDNIMGIIDSSSKSVIADVYQDELIIFPVFAGKEQDIELLVNEVLSYCHSKKPGITITRCTNLVDTTTVRNAYLCNWEYISSAHKLFPHLSYFHYSHISFAKECSQAIQEGEIFLKSKLSSLEPLQKKQDNQDLLNTLTVFLLDAHCSVQKTADILFLHKNTVKYRLGQITKILGYRPQEMPFMNELYLAVALRRLIE